MHRDSLKALETISGEYKHQLRLIDEERGKIRLERSKLGDFEFDIGLEAKECMLLMESFAVLSSQSISSTALAEAAQAAIVEIQSNLIDIEDDLAKREWMLASLEDEARRDFDQQRNKQQECRGALPCG